MKAADVLEVVGARSPAPLTTASSRLPILLDAYLLLVLMLVKLLVPSHHTPPHASVSKAVREIGACLSPSYFKIDLD